MVSIHAPTRGATFPDRMDRRPHRFQSTRPRARPTRHTSQQSRQVSIHAPRGARPTCHLHENAHHGFNPRAHAGRDLICGQFPTSKIVSIHAPTRGATCTFFVMPVAYCEFQSTRPRGARPLPLSSPLSFAGFNPRPGATKQRLMPLLAEGFNPRPRGATYSAKVALL